MRITIKIIFITLLLVLVGFGCTDNSTGSENLSFITGTEGSDVTLEYPDGDKESVGGDRVLGWDGGQLLEGNYFRQIRAFTDKGTLTFRLSIPENIRFADIVEDIHTLRSSRLLLEDTGNLEKVEAELFFQSGEEFSGERLINATGEVEIKQDVSNDGETYELVGEIDAKINNNAGQTVKMTGFIWSKNVKK